MITLSLTEHQRRILFNYLRNSWETRQIALHNAELEAKRDRAAGYRNTDSRVAALREEYNCLWDILKMLTAGVSPWPTTEELEEAAEKGTPVIYGGSVYTVYGIAKRWKNGKRRIDIELMDQNGHSVLITKQERVTIPENAKK